MGLVDDFPGKVKEAVGGSGGEKSSLVNEVLGLLSGAGQGWAPTLWGQLASKVGVPAAGRAQRYPKSLDSLWTPA